jgi:hypothetical protein
MHLEFADGNLNRTRGRWVVGAEEEEEEAQDGEQRDEVHGALPPKRTRRRHLLRLRLHVVVLVVVMAAFLRQELGLCRDAQLPLHPHEISPCSRRNSQGKELAVS